MIEETGQNDTSGQSGIDRETELRKRENETGEQAQQPELGQQPKFGEQDKPEDNFAADKQGSEGGSGFVGSSDDTSSDYLTKGEKQDSAPEGQGASNAGTSDIETGQSTNIDATLDDGADTSQ